MHQATKTITKKRTRSHNSRQSSALSTSMQDCAPISAAWCVGIIQKLGDGCLKVSSGGLLADAQRASSCLMEPANGDSVACLQVAPNEVWIVAVLSREEGVANQLHFLGDTSFSVSGGSLQIHAGSLSLKSNVLNISNQQTLLATDDAQVVGKKIRVTATAIKMVGSALTTVMDRINQFSKHYLRTTDGMDRVAATHVELEATQLMRLNAQHTLVTGEQLVKARGAQIHFG
jgi:hypothetical protein